MYKRILVTLDGSRLSERILPEVEQLTADMEAYVALLTVAAPPEETAQMRSTTKQRTRALAPVLVVQNTRLLGWRAFSF